MGLSLKVIATLSAYFSSFPTGLQALTFSAYSALAGYLQLEFNNTSKLLPYHDSNYHPHLGLHPHKTRTPVTLSILNQLIKDPELPTSTVSIYIYDGSNLCMNDKSCPGTLPLMKSATAVKLQRPSGFYNLSIKFDY